MKQQRAPVTVSLVALMLLVQAYAAERDDADDELLARGEYLTAAAGCVSCHTDTENDGAPFAGSYPLETPFGTFYTPNITPDIETGIGGWSDDEFLAAIKHGIAPDGSRYYPAFPYPSYAGMSDADVLLIKTYLESLAPVATSVPADELRWFVPGGWSLGIWQQLFAPWEYPEAPEEHARGAYLVRHLGHCGECHTPRNLAGQLQLSRDLRGSPKDSAGSSAPPIDAASLREGGWSAGDLEFFLEIGMLPDGDFAGGSMTAVIDDNTGKLTAADRAAIARYLLR
ncbi:MAG: cytochrome c [Gammaproteobacteria bacterium]|nr:cytochrome c [Gammaproteobacteria bacterium]